ncbi:hypothetical protein K490DRAFT_67252 [Saccharata proteae CBS 121410]|uniref:Uncharacterized protein n=1 Tax=Saccharata proteae CBS 121410 TaxID=1314787 RepID=A0A9P4LTY5_9PEZI|nr:hypothetical protein K490DRAFT_67252 [Saccharata proteae CBS 121410]
MTMELYPVICALVLAYLHARASAADATVAATALTTTAPSESTFEEHTISVGDAAGRPTFIPDTTTASIGDIIKYVFYPSNRSVARAAFGYPCVPYEDTVANHSGGFFSGYQPVALASSYNESALPTYMLRIGSMRPIFFYDTSLNSCHGNSMVGVINPVDSNQLESQKALAATGTFRLEPSQAVPSGTSFPTVSYTGTATTSADSDSTTSDSSPSSTSTGGDNDNKSETGLIAGATVGGIAGLALIVALVLLLLRRQRKRKEHTRAKEKDTDLTSLGADPASPFPLSPSTIASRMWGAKTPAEYHPVQPQSHEISSREIYELPGPSPVHELPTPFSSRASTHFGGQQQMMNLGVLGDKSVPGSEGISLMPRQVNSRFYELDASDSSLPSDSRRTSIDHVGKPI